MKSMKMCLCSAALVLVASSNVHATEALLFKCGGYNIEVLIGYLDDPVIAQVHFTPPGAKDWVSLPRELLHVEKFDMKKRILIMHFSNKNDPHLPLRFPFLPTRPGPSSLLAAKKPRANSIGTFNATTKFATTLVRAEKNGAIDQLVLRTDHT
jgi:hypothetical protein